MKSWGLFGKAAHITKHNLVVGQFAKMHSFHWSRCTYLNHFQLTSNTITTTNTSSHIHLMTHSITPYYQKYNTMNAISHRTTISHLWESYHDLKMTIESTTFQEQEEALMDSKGKLHEWSNKGKNVDRYISVFEMMLASTVTECEDGPTHNLSLAPNCHIQVSGIVSGVNTKKGNAEVTPYDLAKRWNIGLETAKKTLFETNQRGLRTSPNPLLSQWYSTNDRMLRYRRLPVDLF